MGAMRVLSRLLAHAAPFHGRLVTIRFRATVIEVLIIRAAILDVCNKTIMKVNVKHKNATVIRHEEVIPL